MAVKYDIKVYGTEHSESYSLKEDFDEANTVCDAMMSFANEWGEFVKRVAISASGERDGLREGAEGRTRESALNALSYVYDGLGESGLSDLLQGMLDDAADESGLGDDIPDDDPDWGFWANFSDAQVQAMYGKMREEILKRLNSFADPDDMVTGAIVHQNPRWLDELMRLFRIKRMYESADRSPRGESAIRKPLNYDEPKGGSAKSDWAVLGSLKD